MRGNHDSHAGDPPSALGIGVVDEPWRLGPFAGCHYPQEAPACHVLAGHVRLIGLPLTGGTGAVERARGLIWDALETCTRARRGDAARGGARRARWR